MNSDHGLDWQDDQMAALARCGSTAIPDGRILHTDGDHKIDYAEQVCPVCGKQLRLVWDVRAEVRGEFPIPDAAPIEQILNVEVQGDTASVDLWYPRNRDIKFVEVGLIDVRAAETLRLSFDYERNGWKIERATIFEWETDDSVQDEGWTEVAFVPDSIGEEVQAVPAPTYEQLKKKLADAEHRIGEMEWEIDGLLREA